ncbi:MAG: NAD(P)H-dependent oxidoreductase [Candidatus Omnitrophica bacterium]|nr:NAD(P)H-dependent oxidoreductase [Candidatus Omnitrophota bacterium]
MRTAVVYYSYSGNTHRVGQLIIGVLKSKGEDGIPVRIRPLKEEVSFIKQCRDAFMRKKPKIYRTMLDLKDYDRIILGSPVWAFNAAPAISTYLEECRSIEGKEAICFVTYGSGAGKDKTLKAMKEKLTERGAKVVAEVSFQQNEGLESCREKLEKIL